MVTQDYVAATFQFLEDSDREFAAGDELQGSEKLWGAASHAVMAVTTQRGWDHRSHQAMKNAVQLLNDETGDDALGGGFAAAEKFHKNFYHNEMEDFEIEIDRPQVRRFVARVLRLLR